MEETIALTAVRSLGAQANLSTPDLEDRQEGVLECENPTRILLQPSGDLLGELADLLVGASKQCIDGFSGRARGALKPDTSAHAFGTRYERALHLQGR